MGAMHSAEPKQRECVQESDHVGSEGAAAAAGDGRRFQPQSGVCSTRRHSAGSARGARARSARPGGRPEGTRADRVSWSWRWSVVFADIDWFDAPRTMSCRIVRTGIEASQTSFFTGPLYSQTRARTRGKRYPKAMKLNWIVSCIQWPMVGLFYVLWLLCPNLDPRCGLYS